MIEVETATSTQVKVESFNTTDWTPQASLDPLLTIAAVVLTLPEALDGTVISWQTATGGTKSTTVTDVVQVLELLLGSVTVNVTTFGPAVFLRK